MGRRVVEMTSSISSDPLQDSRRPAYGAGRALIAVYGLFALSATARASVQLIRNAAEAPLAYSLSAFSAVVYIIATVAMAHNGRKMRKVAWVAVGIELVGVIVVGVLSVTHAEMFQHESVWSTFGKGYFYVPLLLPVLGMWWLYKSSPARLHTVQETSPTEGHG